MALWQGTALCGLAGPWAATAQRALAEERLCTAEEHADVLLALGRHTDAADELASLAAAHPLPEGLWHQLMVARYRSGHPDAALAAYHHARRALTAGLGIEPGPRLGNLYQQILTHDPRLNPPPAR
jgi:DNA-binding SARP family transcriptional activator